MKLLALATAIVLLSSAPPATNAAPDTIYEAVFDQHGITGKISFQQEPSTGNVAIDVKLDGLEKRIAGWHVHVLPVKDHDCGATGGHYNPESAPTTGELTSKHESFIGLTRINKVYIDENIQLSGRNSIVGRSIVLHRQDAINSRWACATIRPKGARTDPYSERIAVASFTGEFDSAIKGMIMFRQFKDSNATQVLVDMRGAGTTAHKWHVHMNPADSTKDAAAGGLCKSTGGHHDPEGREQVANYQCDPLLPDTTCYIGDMAGKHGQLSLTRAGNSPVFFTDMELPLFGNGSIVGLSVTVHTKDAGAPRVTCATIVDLQPVQLVANDFGSDITGSISFSQRTTEYDPTFVRVDFASLGSQSLGSWSIHSFPVPRAGNINCLTKRCGIDATGFQYNPFPGNAIYPVIAVSSKDQFEVGNLGGRWGHLNVLRRSNNTITNRMYVDENLPLAGKHNVNGRSVVLRRGDASKARIGCATIHHYEPERVITAVFGKLSLTFKPDAKAQANERITGTVEIEPAPWGPGVLITSDIRISTVGGSIGHAMHMHMSPVTPSSSAVSDCSSARGHFDPTFKEIQPYVCNPLQPEECYSGDLTGKHGKLLDITEDTKTIIMYDTVLKLDDLVDRSIVIHAANGNRIACGTLTRAATQSISGVVRFSQTRRRTGPSPGTTIETILKRVDGGVSKVHKWHIHSNAPGNDGNAGVCSSTGAHFDPFLAKPSPLPEGALPYPAPLAASDTFYEVGDLTGKHGTVDFGSSNVGRTLLQYDRQLPLAGPYTISGRSVAIHVANGGSGLMACAPLVEVCPIPYTLCAKPSDCAAARGGLESHWECVARSLVKEANCIPVSSSCEKVVCANTAIQQVFKDNTKTVGHCKPSFQSHDAFDYNKVVKVGRQMIYQTPVDVTEPVGPTEGPAPGSTEAPTTDFTQALEDGVPVILGVCALGIFFGLMIRNSRRDAKARNRPSIASRISARFSSRRRPPQASAGTSIMSKASTHYKRQTMKNKKKSMGFVQHTGHAASSGRFSMSDKLPTNGPLSRPSAYSLTTNALKQKKGHNRVSLPVSESSIDTGFGSASTYTSQGSMNRDGRPQARGSPYGMGNSNGSVHRHVRGGANGSKPRMTNKPSQASMGSNQSAFSNTGLLNNVGSMKDGAPSSPNMSSSMASRASGAFRSLKSGRPTGRKKTKTRGDSIDIFV